MTGNPLSDDDLSKVGTMIDAALRTLQPRRNVGYVLIALETDIGGVPREFASVSNLGDEGAVMCVLEFAKALTQ